MANKKRLAFKSRSICFLLTLVFFLGVWTTTVFAQALEDIVDQFFPETLIRESLEEFEQGGADPFKAFDFVAADLAGAGRTDFIVAAYTNGISAAIRVLQRQGSGFVLADEPNLPTLTGGFPEVKLLDLDRDKRPEIIASFLVMRAEVRPSGSLNGTERRLSL